MRPGTRLSLADDRWLVPIVYSEPACEEHVIALVENFAAFVDGEVVRLPMQPDDEIEDFEGAILCAPRRPGPRGMCGRSRSTAATSCRSCASFESVRAPAWHCQNSG